MLYSSNTGDNEFIVTLYEKCNNIINPFFTWELTHIDTNTKYYVYMNDNSVTPYYYNSFTFSTNNNYKIGQYTYRVYEMATASNLNIGAAIGLVENGILTITGTFSEAPIISFTQSQNDIIKEFRN